MSSSQSNEKVSPLTAVAGVARTDIGLKREENQDFYGVIEGERAHLYVVADGMGGTTGGARASRLAVETVLDALRGDAEFDPPQLVAAVTKANRNILQEALANPGSLGMGTTFVGLAFVGTTMMVVNVGDSRAYRIRQGVAHKLTEDHTLVNELIKSGALSREQAHNHPVSHMLTRSLGPAQEVLVDCDFLEAPRVGDRYLLCSDGLYNLVADQEIAEIVGREQDSGQACEGLIELAKSRGGHDNITVLLVAITEGYPAVNVANSTPRVASEPALTVLLPRKGEQPYSTRIAPLHSSAEESQGREKRWLTREKTVGAMALLACLLVGYGFSTLLQSIPSTGGSGAVVVDGNGGRVAAAPVSQEQIRGQQGAAPSTLAGGQGSAGGTSSASSSRRLAADGSGVEGVTVALSSEQRRNIETRLTALIDRRKALEIQSTLLESPTDAALADIKTRAETRLNGSREQLEQVREKLDAATRRLALWHGRRKRLREGEPIDLATELAATSQAVSEKLREFQDATHAYLREADAVVYNPADAAQQARFGELIRVRKQRLEELAQAIKNATTVAVNEVDQQVAELSMERDRLYGEVEMAKVDSRYVEILSQGDGPAKTELAERIENERIAISAEIDSLNHLLNPELASFKTSFGAESTGR